MSFSKASQIIELSEMIAAQRRGINHDDVMERFRCSLRTAQRMMSMIEYMYPDVVSYYDDEGRKRWRFEEQKKSKQSRLDPNDMTTLELVEAAFISNGSSIFSQSARRLKEKVISIFPHAYYGQHNGENKNFVDFVSFDVRPRIDDDFILPIEERLVHAIKNDLMIDIDYGYNGRERKFKCEPYGILFGEIPRLVANLGEGSAPSILIFDLIREIAVSNESFQRPKDFNLNEFGERFFNGSIDDSDYCDIHWRFLGADSEEAKKYIFHPKQRVEIDDEGSVHVRFKAAGQKQMCDFLLRWGDQVDVIEPLSLKEMYDVALKIRKTA